MDESVLPPLVQLNAPTGTGTRAFPRSLLTAATAAGQTLRIDGVVTSRQTPPTPLSSMLVTWTEERQGLDLAGPSVLGSLAGQPSLVILPGVLQPGLSYLFQLNVRLVRPVSLPSSVLWF